MRLNSLLGTIRIYIYILPIGILAMLGVGTVAITGSIAKKAIQHKQLELVPMWGPLAMLVGLAFLVPAMIAIRYTLATKGIKGDPNRFARVHRRVFDVPEECGPDTVFEALHNLQRYTCIHRKSADEGTTITGIRNYMYLEVPSLHQWWVLRRRLLTAHFMRTATGFRVTMTLAPLKWYDAVHHITSFYFFDELLDALDWRQYEVSRSASSIDTKSKH